MTILYFILALIALGVLVFIHELGHYFMARWMGMTVEIFSIGFGKPLLKWKWRGVDWQLALLPFGGFVKISGMEFGKKDKIEPYEIPGGFFQKHPLKRIAVALAGPFSNFLLAFLVFVLLWAMGGREKPFADYTKVIGWVDPQSEIYALGVRPGDLLSSYNGKPYTSSKDLLYAAMLEDRNVELKGSHVDYETGKIEPFSYRIRSYPSPYALDDILTTGIMGGASYLIYDKFAGGADNPLPQGSPMEGSGIQYGDRLVWADGELLFSMQQLSDLLNDERAFLTVKRGDQIFFSRQKRLIANDLNLSSAMKNELIDWQYEAGIKGRWQRLYILPYTISPTGTIEGYLEGEKERGGAFVFHRHLENRLQIGDQIIAVDGVKVETAYQLLNKLQSKQLHIIVEKGVSPFTYDSTQVADTKFLHSIDMEEMNKIAQSIGSAHLLSETAHYSLLQPIVAKRATEFVDNATLQKQTADYESKKEKIEGVSDKEKRARMKQILTAAQNKYFLAIYLQDKQVTYNPNPLALFGTVVAETWTTLKALFSGYLHPKWLSGPIGIVQIIQYGWKVGIGEALFWIGAISINLGVLNLLPIPVLDGGYICLSLWEWITKRRLKAQTMERLIIPFVVLLIGLLLFLTFQDISRFF